MSDVHDGTLNETRENITRAAKRDFAEHVVTEEGQNEWRCGKPDSSISMFRVIVRPGHVIVYGDIGDWILRMAERDPLRWLPGAVQSWDYLLGKLQTPREKTFYVGDALAWLEEQAADEEDPEGHAHEALAEARRAHEFRDLYRHRWGEIMIEHGFETECCGFGTLPSAREFWLVEALKWFSANVIAKAKERPAAAGPTP